MFQEGMKTPIFGIRLMNKISILTFREFCLPGSYGWATWHFLHEL